MSQQPPDDTPTPSDTGGLSAHFVAPLETAATYGVVAFALGFLVTYLLTSGASAQLTDALTSAGSWGVLSENAVSGPSDVTVTGWAFFLSQQATLTASSTGATCVTGAQMGSLVEQVTPTGLLQLLVPASIAATAYYAVSNAGDVEKPIQYGANLVVGYFPLALLGTVLFEAQAKLDCEQAGIAPVHTFSLDPVGTAVIAGLVYPVVFGAIGGYLASTQ